MVRGNVRSSPGCHQRRIKLSWRKSSQLAGGNKELERNGWKVKGGILVDNRVGFAWEGWRTTSIFSRWAPVWQNMRHTSCSPLLMLAHWFRRKIHFHHLLQQMFFTNLIQTMSWDKLDPNNISRQTAGGSGHCWCSHHRRQHQPPPKHHPYNEKWASILWSRWYWLATLAWVRLAWCGGSLRYYMIFSSSFLSSLLFVQVSSSLFHYFIFVFYCIYCCCCGLISFSYSLNSSFVCCLLLLMLFTLCFFISLFVCYSLLPRKKWMSLSGHVPAWARSDYRRRLYDQDCRDWWRED